MKKLKFTEPLPELILDGYKYNTWRIDDEKNILVGDELSLCHLNEQEFVKAKVVSVKETTFGNLTDEDKKGHEEFESCEQMYKTYSGYYKTTVTPETQVKVIKFRLI